MKRVFWLVMDGVGVGAAADAKAFGDEGANTLSNLAREVLKSRGTPLQIPNLLSLGAGLVTEVAGTETPNLILGSHGKAQEQSQGKDTTSGHWEMAGLPVATAFPVYEHDFRMRSSTVGFLKITSPAYSETALQAEPKSLIVWGWNT
jgi:phosphopentomutase